MSNEVSPDQISRIIDGKLDWISSNNTNYDQFICRIDKKLRETSEAAYEPEMVSIGPYHRGKNNLQRMEKYKLENLKGILERQEEKSVGRYIDILSKEEKDARRFYADQVTLTQEEFVEMMLLDGCFIIEFLRKYDDNDHDHDPIFKIKWMSEIIKRDLLLFENQIPFFILVKLFDMTKISSNNPTVAAVTKNKKEKQNPTVDAADCWAESSSTWSGRPCVASSLIPTWSNGHHQLDSNNPNTDDDDDDQGGGTKLISLAVSCLCDVIDARSPSSNININPNTDDDDQVGRTKPISLAVSCLGDVIDARSPSSNIKIKPEEVLHLLSLMYKYWCSSYESCINIGRTNGEEEEDLDNITFIKSVTELKQDGIKFVEATQSTSWLDIKFEDGEIKIPPLVIHDNTESTLRNLIVYEQYMFDLGHSRKFVTDYATFMDCLINTPMDVQKLRVEGIIKHYLGSDEKMTDMFNNITKNIFFSPPDFTYRKHSKKMKEYCKDRRNRWISDLKNTHFKNPWSIISIVAAAILLILTLIQTICSCK